MKKVYSLLSLVVIFIFVSCSDSNVNYPDRNQISEVKKGDLNSEVMIFNEMNKFKKEVKLHSGRIARIEFSMEDSRDL